MNRKPELEELLAAAARRLADRQRQLQLAEMIDQMAKEEAAPAPKRRKAAVWIGIAASIALAATVAITLTRNNDMAQSHNPMVAQSYNPATTQSDNNDITQSPDNATQRDHNITIAQSRSIKESPAYNYDDQPLPETQTYNSTQTDPTSPLVADTGNPQTNTAQQDEDDPSPEMADDQTPTVYTRSSTKLVSVKKGPAYEPPLANSRQQNSAPISFVSTSRTETTFHFKSVKL